MGTHDKLKLRPKQALFVKEYLVDRNAARAARAAGYSEKTARAIGCKLLTKVDIQAAINQTTAPIIQKLELTIEKVLKDIEDLRIICKEEKKNRHVALKASELQGKYLKAWTEKVEHSGNIDLESQTEEQLKRRLEALESED